MVYVREVLELLSPAFGAGSSDADIDRCATYSWNPQSKYLPYLRSVSHIETVFLNPPRMAIPLREWPGSWVFGGDMLRLCQHAHFR